LAFVEFREGLLEEALVDGDIGEVGKDVADLAEADALKIGGAVLGVAVGEFGEAGEAIE